MVPTPPAPTISTLGNDIATMNKEEEEEISEKKFWWKKM